MLDNSRFNLSQASQEDIYGRTDLDLGNWLLGKLRYQLDQQIQPELVAFVEYQPGPESVRGAEDDIAD